MKIVKMLQGIDVPLTIVFSLTSVIASAQAADGNTGINQANTMVRGYFDSLSNLLYAAGAIVAIWGAFRVFSAWNSESRDAGKLAVGWFGSCIFLVVVATVIKSFFGL